MKKLSIGSITILLAIVFPVCVFGAPAYEGGATFGKDVERTEWILSEFRAAGKTVRIDRQKTEANNMGGIYTISFEEGRVGGMGAPNRFFGSYTAGSNRALSIGNVASTMMASFWEPDELKEFDYFRYLSGVTRWDLREGLLELYGSSSEGAEIVLVFVLKNS